MTFLQPQCLYISYTKSNIPPDWNNANMVNTVSDSHTQSTLMVRALYLVKVVIG